MCAPQVFAQDKPPLPAQEATFTVKGRTHYAAPILEMLNPVYEITGEIKLTPLPDHDYYLQVAGRIDHSRACLSVARKLCRRAHHLLRELGDQALAPVESEPQAEEAMQAAA